MTTPNTELAEQARTYLEGIGLTDRPEEYGDGIHGWRCEHPDRYGRCDCLADAVADLAKLVDATVKRGQAEALRDAAENFRYCADYSYRATRIRATEDYLLARARKIEKETPDEQ